MIRATALAFVLVVAAFGGAETMARAAQDGVVKVTATRANIRAEASDQASVVTQVTAGMTLTLKAIVGDWFRVELPPDPRLGGARVEAFLSKKVATLVTAPADTPSPVAVAPAPAPDPLTGLSVALQSGGVTSAMAVETARLRTIEGRADSVAALAGVLPIEDAPVTARGAQLVTYVWTIAGRSASRVVADHRPAFVAQFKTPPGAAPEDVMPMIVRLTSALSGVRIAAAVRARADQADRPEADWDVMKDFKQEPIKATVDVAEPGTARVVAATDLAAGEYALVFRPAGRKKWAGAAVLGESAVIFTTAWTFSVR